MPTRRSRPRAVTAAALLATLALTTSGCSLFSHDDEQPEPSASPSPSAEVTRPDAPPDALEEIVGTLRRRADAVLRGDEQAFLDGVAWSDRRFRKQQRIYFDNVRQLPVASFGYTVDPAGLVRDGEDYWAVVDLSLQLDSFDDAPVVYRDRLRFTPNGKGDRFRLSSVRDPKWEVDNKVLSQPWDSGRILVVRDTSVLGIFDPSSVRASMQLVNSIRRGVTDVAGIVPSSWSKSVVVYALSDTAFLTKLPGLLGADPAGLDLVTFPLFASAGDDDDLVSTRLVLHPRLLDQPGRARDRLVRHELTHVALGAADDRAPLWLSEGVAEYVSVQSLPLKERAISEAALAAARAGVTEMPDDDAFNDAATPGRASAPYGIAWFACEYLAATFGEVTLWQLIAALDDPDVDVDRILTSQVGLDSRTLARNAGKLMLMTYAPPPPVEPPPTDLPTDLPTSQPTTPPVPLPTPIPPPVPPPTPTPTDLPTDPSPSIPPVPRARRGQI